MSTLGATPTKMLSRTLGRMTDRLAQTARFPRDFVWVAYSLYCSRRFGCLFHAYSIISLGVDTLILVRCECMILLVLVYRKSAVDTHVNPSCQS